VLSYAQKHTPHTTQPPPPPTFANAQPQPLNRAPLCFFCLTRVISFSARRAYYGTPCFSRALPRSIVFVYPQSPVSFLLIEERFCFFDGVLQLQASLIFTRPFMTMTLCRNSLYPRGPNMDRLDAAPLISQFHHADSFFFLRLRKRWH